MNYLRAIDFANQNIQDFPYIPILIGPKYSVHATEIENKNRELCHKWGGQLVLVTPKGPNSTYRMWAPPTWDEQVEHTVAAIASLVPHFHTRVDEVRIVANDVLYATLPQRLIEAAFDDGPPLRQMWIPHSSAHGYAGPAATRDPFRLHREDNAIRNASIFGYKIGAIGPYFQTHLIEKYGAHRSTIKLLKGGIIASDFTSPLLEPTVMAHLQKQGIPLGKKYVFSMGQGIAIKGHDLAIRAFASVKRKLDWDDLHLVIVAPSRPYQDPEHDSRLLYLIQRFRLEESVTYIPRFNTEVAPAMYQHPQTLAMLIPVRESPEDLIPMECRANPKNLILVTSSQGSNTTQVTDSVDGFTADISAFLEPPSLADFQIASDSELLLGPCDLVTKLECAVTLSGEVRRRMVHAGRKTIDTQFNLKKNIDSNLDF